MLCSKAVCRGYFLITLNISKLVKGLKFKTEDKPESSIYNDLKEY